MDGYQAVLIDFGKTQTFEECNESQRGTNEYEKAADLQALATMCKDLELHEHAKVFPNGANHHALVEAREASPEAFRYVHDLDYHPERNTMHLMPCQGHPASKLLPGLLGYAVCSKCQGLGNLAEQIHESGRSDFLHYFFPFGRACRA